MAANESNSSLKILPQSLIMVVDLAPLVFVQVVFIFFMIGPCCCRLCKYKSSKAKLEQNLKNLSPNSPILTRSILPILKKGDSETDTRLFDYKVPTEFIMRVMRLDIMLLFVILNAMGIFWQDLFIQSYSYQSELDRELVFCYNEKCLDPECPKFYCYKFDFDFGKALSNAVDFFALFISINSIITVTLLLVSGGKNGSKIRKLCAILLHFVILLVCDLFYYSLIYMSMVSLVNNLHNVYIHFVNICFNVYVFVILLNVAIVYWCTVDKVPHERLALDEPYDSLTKPFIVQENEDMV